jgi:hypothetical protein
LRVTLQDRAEAEIVGLHRFFQRWFNGTLPNDAEGFATFEAALAPGFRIISPRGVVDGRDAILESLRSAHGQRAGAMRIWIQDVQLVAASGGQAVATYQEWQQVGDEPARGRFSTVVFSVSESALQWLHVHETWLPNRGE